MASIGYFWVETAHSGLIVDNVSIMFFVSQSLLTFAQYCGEYRPVSDVTYPRSPREQMAGWCWLPRFVDKIRLNAAGKLHPDYQPNFCHKGFDLAWLEAAGLEGDAFVRMVEATVTDGEVCDWVSRNARASDADKEAFREKMEFYGRDESNAELRALLQKRKENAGLGDRDDIQCFVDYIEADEGRS